MGLLIGLIIWAPFVTAGYDDGGAFPHMSARRMSLSGVSRNYAVIAGQCRAGMLVLRVVASGPL
jgi:hypothetical protein